jgi:GNAT superfamily N-acetyltransferase
VDSHQTIRQGLPTDAAALISIDHLARTDAHRAEFIRRRLQEGSCFVCEMNGSPVGYAVLDHHFFGNGMIVMLYTRAECRRTGVGSALLQHCEIACHTAKLFTSTNQSNKAMQALLARHGYVPSGFIENLDEGDPELVYFKKKS